MVDREIVRAQRVERIASADSARRARPGGCISVGRVRRTSSVVDRRAVAQIAASQAIGASPRGRPGAHADRLAARRAQRGHEPGADEAGRTGDERSGLIHDEEPPRLANACYPAAGEESACAIGVAGLNAAGKGEVVRLLEAQLLPGLALRRDPRRAGARGSRDARAHDRGAATRSARARGPGGLARARSPRSCLPDRNYVIDSIRHPAEVEVLRAARAASSSGLGGAPTRACASSASRARGRGGDPQTLERAARARGARARQRRPRRAAAARRAGARRRHAAQRRHARRAAARSSRRVLRALSVFSSDPAGTSTS